MPHQARKNDRFDLRLSEEQKNIFETAATLSGQTLTSFFLSNMIEKAQLIIKNYKEVQQIQQTILSARDSKRFIEILEDNKEPNKALKAAYSRYKKNKKNED